MRDLADAPLAGLFGTAGCPMCRRVAAIEERFIDAMLYESVNDVRFRGELDRARGFCGRHAGRILALNRATAGSLAAAILFAAVLRVRRPEIEELVRSSGRGRARRAEAAAAPPDCPVCAQVTRGVEDAAASFVRLSAEPSWAAALGSAEFCLPHLVTVLAAPGARTPDAWADVQTHQVERLATLQARLDAFAHHSSEDRRHLLTDDERASVDEAARTLGG